MVLHLSARAVRLPVAMAALAGLAACGESVTGVEDVRSVSVVPIVDSLTAIGAVVLARSEPRDGDGNIVVGVPVTWASTDRGVVLVDRRGVVTAQGNGTAYVRATVGELADSTPVVVSQIVQDVAVSFRFDTLFVWGIRARLSAQVTDSNGVDVPASHIPRAWTTTDSTVATVDGEGRVTPIGPGSVTMGLRVAEVEVTQDLVVAPEDTVTGDATLAEALHWALEDALPATDRYGVAGAVILSDGSEWIGTTGWSGPGSRLRPNAITALGSIAKTAAGAVLLSVIDEGLVSIDDTVGQWVSPLPNVSPSVTMRQLLNNSSGIANYGAHPNFGDSVFADTSRLWTHQELVERFTGPPEFTPGERYKSTNTGFVLSLMIAAAATGEGHHALIRERLFEPLSLGDAIHIVPWEPNPPAHLEPGWFMDGAGQLVEFSPFMHTSLMSSRAIGLMASVRGMAVFFRELVAGDLLSDALRAEALTAIPDDGFIPGQDGAGLALRRYNYLGSRQWGHSGAVSNGSGIVFHDVDLGVTVAVLFNVNPLAHQNVHFTLAPRLLEIVRDAEN